MGETDTTRAAQAEAGETNSRTLFFVVGGYVALLAGYRLVEVLPAAARGAVVDGYADWLLPYLAFVCGLLLCAGTLALVAGATARRDLRRSGIAGVVGGGALLAFVSAHAYFLVQYEHSFADGGLVWGVVHSLTLTRLATTGAEAGVAGYKVGLGVGMVVWSFVGLLTLGAGLNNLQTARGERLAAVDDPTATTAVEPDEPEGASPTPPGRAPRP